MIVWESGAVICEREERLTESDTMPVDNRRIPGPEETRAVILNEEKAVIKPVVNDDGRRQDGRRVDELRAMFIRVGIVSQAKGSAYIEMKCTKVICAVYGPRESLRRQEYRNKGKLTCEFKFAPFSCQLRRLHIQDSQEKDYSAVVVQALETAVCLDRFPKAQVDIFITVLENDGSALAAGINCASLALADAGIEMTDLVTACSLVQFKSHSLLDPTVRETQSKEVNGSITLALLPSLNLVSGLIQDGELKHDCSVNAVKACIEGCARLYPVFQENLVKSVERKFSDKGSST